MSVWREMLHDIARSTFVSPWMMADEGTGTARCDALGVFPIPAGEMEEAIYLGVDSHLLAVLFPAGPDGIRLSRGAMYYQPATLIRHINELVDGCELIDLAQDRLSSVHFAMFENLLNVLAAVTFALWEDACKQDSAANTAWEGLLSACRSVMRVLIRPAARGSGECWAWGGHELPAPGEWFHRVRSFRELDNLWKIAHEVGYLSRWLLPSHPDVSTILLPMYGSFSLGLAIEEAAAATPSAGGIRVQYVRIGFHDLAPIPFIRSDNRVDLSLIAPARARDELNSAIASSTVLVVDDNAGYGTTLRACRTLICQLGGIPLTRSVETAWDLYEKRGNHDIASAVDFPGLRPNFHHSLQKRLMGALAAGDISSYIGDSQHSGRLTLSRQMANNFELAQAVGTWSEEQLSAMRKELAVAALFWREPAIPVRSYS